MLISEACRVFLVEVKQGLDLGDGVIELDTLEFLSRMICVFREAVDR